MVEKIADRLITDRDRLKVRFTTERGKVKDIELVQYEAQIEGKWIPLVRYDMAHGYLHRDIMHPDGSKEKIEIPYTDLADPLTEAIEHLYKNFEFYRRMYEERMR